MVFLLVLERVTQEHACEAAGFRSSCFKIEPQIMGDNFSLDAVQRVDVAWGYAIPKVEHVVLTANIESVVHKSLIKAKKVIFSIAQKFMCDRICGAF